MPDSLLQLASTIFLTFGLGTLLYALVTYVLKQIVGEEPQQQARRGMSYPTGPQQAGPYGPPRPQYHPHAMPPQGSAQHLPGYGLPPSYPVQGPRTPPGAPRG